MGHPTQRPNSSPGRRALAAATAVLVGLVALPHEANAAVRLDTYRENTDVLPGGSEVDVPVFVHFHLDRAGLFYAKLLDVPWNPINDGRPNGTVKPDNSVGVSGWWIEFDLADENGTLLETDARGAPIDASLGAYVDSTPTPPVFLEANRPHVLVAVVHVPAPGAISGSTYRVPFALAYREGNVTGDTVSGARLDQSVGFTEVLSFAAVNPPPAPALDENASGPLDAVSQTPSLPADSVVLSGPLASTLAVLLVVATIANVVLLVVVVAVWRAYRLERRGPLE